MAAALAALLALAACGAAGCGSDSSGSASAPSAEPSLTLTDCQGNIYKVVEIGGRYWMAENLRCTQYDSLSERAGAELTASGPSSYAPYCTDGRGAESSTSAFLASEHRAKLGLLYNWAAAMGYASEAEAQAQTGDYDGDRQGICPNGWHLPSRAEWTALNDYAASQDTAVSVGKRFKSAAGWYVGDGSVGNGTDAYGFAALPAGDALGSTVFGAGEWTNFWSSGANGPTDAYFRHLHMSNDDFREWSNFKDDGLSVRCVRD